MASKESNSNLPPHVVIFPLPAQGHLNAMLNLAHLLSLHRGLHVTFIISHYSHRRLLSNSSLPSIPGFQLIPLPDGIPADHPRAGSGIMEIIYSVNHTMVTLFKKKLIQEAFFAIPGTRRPVTCIIADGILELTNDIGIPLVSFRTPGAAYFWTFVRTRDLVEAGEIPFEEKDMDELVKSVPGIEGFLRRRDLPSFFRTDDVNDPILQSLATVTEHTLQADAAIFNTFEELEGPIISGIRTCIPRTFTIGPIHAHLKSMLKKHAIQGSVFSGGFWTEDRSCIDWLNTQMPKSVIYVSFGSITTVTREQLLELWYGLVHSHHRFLWVIRPNSVIGEGGENKLPLELEEGTKERGYLVDWAPQEEVLNHPAVGGFFTHNGWNSTLECIVAGVPMICWPYFADQMVNSRLVSTFWKTGLDIKDTCDRVVVENAVKEIMEVRKDEFQERAGNLAKLAEKAVSPMGSSHSNLDGFIDYINSLII